MLDKLLYVQRQILLVIDKTNIHALKEQREEVLVTHINPMEIVSDKNESSTVYAYAQVQQSCN